MSLRVSHGRRAWLLLVPPWATAGQLAALLLPLLPPALRPPCGADGVGFAAAALDGGEGHVTADVLAPEDGVVGRAATAAGLRLLLRESPSAAWRLPPPPAPSVGRAAAAVKPARLSELPPHLQALIRAQRLPALFV